MSKNSDFAFDLSRCNQNLLIDFDFLCQNLQQDLQRNISQKRFEHILRVRKACSYLAQRFECNQQFLELAALLHDMARELPVEQQFEILYKDGFCVDEIMRKNPVLAHAKVASVLAVNKYKLPKEVAQIISYHTTGKAHMNLEECLFFLADALEPGREWSSWKRLEQACEDLRNSLKDCVRWKLDYTLKRGKMIHPHSLECWNWLCDKRCA